MEFQRRYDLMYMKTKELGWNETQGIQGIGVEDSQGNRIIEQRQVLKIWENYIAELYDRPNRPETLEVELEEAADTAEKGPHILQSEVEKIIKEMKNRNGTGDVLKLLGKGGLKILTKLSNTIYNTGEWPKDFNKSFNDCVEEEDKSYKMQRLLHNQPYCSYSYDNSKDT